MSTRDERFAMMRTASEAIAKLCESLVDELLNEGGADEREVHAIVALATVQVAADALERRGVPLADALKVVAESVGAAYGSRVELEGGHVPRWRRRAG